METARSRISLFAPNFGIVVTQAVACLYPGFNARLNLNLAFRSNQR
jgi:hypothetical protein